MAEVNKPASAPPSLGGARGGTGFELRLERGGASVRLVDKELAPGLTLDALAIQIPDVRFPFDVGQGAAQFRHRLADLTELFVTVGAPFLDAALARAPLGEAGLLEVRAELRQGFAELTGRLAAGPAFTVKAGLLPQAEHGVRLLFHSPRVFGLSPLPGSALPHLLARAFGGALGEGGTLDAVAPLLRFALAPRGWKIPRTTGVRLTRVEVADGALRLGWAAAADAAAVTSDPDLLAAEEGAAAFARAEAAIAAGDFGRARELLLAAGHSASVHPFAAERLLSLFLLEERFHEEVLDLSADWLGRRPGFAPALAADALVRLGRGERHKAAHAWVELARFAAERGEVFSALAAAEVAFETPGVTREDAARAVDVALGLRRDHVPALRALRALSVESGDREALLRADRRIVAYDPDDAQKARAHAELGELLREADPAAARLHLDQALRLAPDDAMALTALARACGVAGEPLRAVRALDRLRDVHLARNDRAAAAAVALEAGALWDGPLDHPENAALRYRAAIELSPSPEAHARLAVAAERLGQWVEAADHHAAVLASLDPAAPGAPATLARTRLALADVAERRLGDPAGAAAHLEAAAALQPDEAVLRRLADLHRALRRPDGLAAALDRLAPLVEPAERAALLAEAGEALLSIGQAEPARGRFTAALAHDGVCRPALLGLSRLAATRGDVLAERDALSRLVPLAQSAAEAADLQDRLAAACEAAGDLTGAARAARAARNAVPSAARLVTELRVLRRAGDTTALTALLPEAAQAAAAAGEPAQAAALRLEQARLLAPEAPAAALAALAEAHAAAPGDPAVLRAQAELAERTGDLRLTLAALRALLATQPPDAPALDLRAGRAALAAGEVTAAREHATRAEAAGAAGGADLLSEVLSRTGDGVARAELLVRVGRLDEAAELYQRTGRPLEAAPLLARLGRHEAAARAWQAGGDLAQAAAALAHAAEDPAAAADLLPRLVEARLALQDAPGAAAALLRLARLRSGAEAAQLAWRSHELHADPAAVDLAAAADPSFAPARARRAELRAGDDPRGALADAEAALASPDLPDEARPGLLGLAWRAAEAVNDAEATLRHLEAYSARAPDDDDALARLAVLHKRAGDAAALAAILDRRIGPAAGPEAVALRLERAELHLHEGDAAPAIRLLEQALELDPSSLAALRALTDPPLAGEVPAARRAELLGRRAAHPDAASGEVHAALAARARLLAEAGRGAEALAALQGAAARGPLDDADLELRAALAGAAGAAAEAAEALLERARRAQIIGEAGVADRLAEAGLAAEAAGVPGADEALEAALRLGPGRENARAVRLLLLRRARAAGDDLAERALLAALVPVLRTGERPAALLRLSALALAAEDVPAARAAAEEARLLAPRDPAAVEAARATAEREGDLAAVADRLHDLAEILPDQRGQRLLARARLLAFLGRPREADLDFSAALAVLPPDRALAEEHLRLRRLSLPAASAAEPLERYAARITDRKEQARAFRTAAALALLTGDRATALRCARRAVARTRDDLSFAGPLLARLLYEGGSWAEALVLHRRLFDAGLDRLPPEDALVLSRQLADLAEESGEIDLARAALDQVLALRPSDLDAARKRFGLDPDRARAARDLAAQADFCRSAARRAEALAAAAEASLAEIGDAPLADLLFRRARDAALRLPARAAAMARRRVEAFRAAEGTKSPLVVEALGEAAEQALKSGNRAEARELLSEAAARARDRGQLANAARSVFRLHQLAAEDGDRATAIAHAREAGDLFAWAGMLKEAAGALQGAVALDPSDLEALALLEAVARAQGPDGAALLADVLAQRIERSEPGPVRAELRVALADAHLEAGGPGSAEKAEAELRRALEEDPGCTAASERLSERLASAGREAERARLLLQRAAHETDESAAAQLRREAALLLAAAPGAADRAIAAATFAELAARDPKDLEAHRSAARLFRDLGQREKAIAHLAALVRADPEDEVTSRELADAYSDRHRERGELFLQRAENAHGETRAVRLREAAKAFFAAADDGRARAALLEAFEAWPADDTAFVAALREATTDVDRIDAVLAARANAVPGEAAACHRARADALLAFGETDRAVNAYRTALEVAPDDVAALAALAACLADAGRDAEARAVDARLVTHVDAGAVPPSAEASARYRLGLAAWAEGRPAEGIPHLERALSLTPGDERAGIAWAALAHGHAARGDGPMALAAARSRAERALALGLVEERRQALEAGAELASQLGEAGRDAAEILVALLQLRHADGEPAEALEPLARRTALVLEGLGEADRAREALAVAGVSAPPPPPASGPELHLDSADGLEPSAAPGVDGLGQSESPLDSPDGPEPSAAPGVDGLGPPESPLDSPDGLGPPESPLDSPDGLEPSAAPGVDGLGPSELEPARSIEGPPEDLASSAATLVDLRRPELSAPPEGAAPRPPSPEPSDPELEDLEIPDLDLPGFDIPEPDFTEAPSHVDVLTGPPPPAEEPAPAIAPPAPPQVAPEPPPAPPPPPPSDPRELARQAAERALAIEDPAARSAAFIAYAEALAAAGAPLDDLRTALDLAAEADPDAAAPWRARARLEVDACRPLEAARAHLSVSIRTDSEEAARSALEAARLFQAAGLATEAARAFRAAIHADPGSIPARQALAEEAMAAGDAEAASVHLSAIDPDFLPVEERPAFARSLATALEAAGRGADAEAVWTVLLQADPGDAEAFAHAADLVRARGAVDSWIELSLLHEQALAADGDAAGRAALRLQRGEVLASDGRLEAAREAILAALELVPGYAAAGAALAALDARAEAWAEVAAALAAEAARTTDPAARAALHLRRARILHERLRDDAAAGAAAAEAVADARTSPAAAAGRTSADAEALRADLGLEAATSAPAPPPDADPVSSVLRAQAEVAHGPERAELFERLAGHLERSGDLAGAADALLEALEADPEREATHAWLESIAVGDEPRLARAAALRRAVKPEGEASSPLPELPPLEVAAPPPVTAGPEVDLFPPLDLGLELTALDAPPEPEPELPERTLELELEPSDRATSAGSAVPPPSAEEDAAARGRRHLAAGRHELAYAALSEALEQAPDDLDLVRDLYTAAEEVGEADRYAELGERLADAAAPANPMAAAVRLRQLAGVLRTRFAQPERAAQLLEKALTLVPGDPDTRRELAGVLAERPRNAPRALESWLGIVRQDPSDAGALAALAALCARVPQGADAATHARLAELGRLAASLAAYVAPGAQRPAPQPLPTRIPPDLRAQLAVPVAVGPSARLLSLLAPWLEPLFPADLGRRGASSADWLAPPRAPALRGALEAASRALGTRPHAAFLTRRPGLEAAVENTQPPAMVFSAGVEALPESTLPFLAARTLDLVHHGWALAGKFAPRDVGILLELACRFAGGTAPSLGLPAERAGSYLAALTRTVPAGVLERARILAAESARELARFEPGAFGEALRRTANRMALLYAGDPGEALRALAALEAGGGAPPVPGQALTQPDLADLASFALSDRMVELRLAVLG